jgi:LuxR family transcriptional regulator, maltose regulon positive regulatory protein
MSYSRKLVPPKVRSGYLARPQLYRTLECWRALRALVIYAPAGYGKSSLISGWIAAHDPPVPLAWLSLDADDRDPTTFVSMLAAALEVFIPESRINVQRMLEEGQVAPEQVLRWLLSNMEAVRFASGAEQHCLLVLDDLHLAQSPPIDLLLMTILEQGPVNLHLFLLSRHVPTLPLARWYAQEEIADLRGDDLRLTASEIRLYLAQKGFPPPSDAEIAELMRLSEGWITALQLAMLTQRAAGSIDSLLRNLHATNRWLAEYLIGEVLRQQPAALRDFLLCTSILESFNAPLCVAVTGDEQAYRTLREIQQADLFLIPLDEQQEWFRYHHLFQALLRHELHVLEGVAGVEALHRRAAAWFTGAGAIPEAVHHLRAAGDEAAILALLAERIPGLVLRDPYRVRQWFEFADQQLLVRHPTLMLERCRLECMLDNRELLIYVQQAEQAFADDELSPLEAARHQATLAVYRAVGHFLQADLAATATSLQQAQQVNLALDGFSAGTLEFIQMHLCRYNGRFYAIETHALRAIAAFEDANCLAAMISVRRELSRHAAQVGSSYEASHQISAIVQEPRADQPFVLRELLLTYIWAVEHSYWKNDFAEARGFQHRAQQLAQQLQSEHLSATVMSHGMLCDLADPAAEPTAPEAIPISLVRKFRPDLAVRLLLARGRYGEAWYIAESFGIRRDSNPAHISTGILRVFLQAYIARGIDLDAILPLLDGALVYYSAMNNRFGRLHLLVLKAAHTLRTLDANRAAPIIDEAIGLALETGYLRVLLNVPDIQPLLANSDHPQISALLRGGGRTPVSPFEPLTAQERSVLVLLAQDYRYAQIAQELTISINTVRTHVRHIYRKLGAQRRGQAIECAKKVGILRKIPDA